MCPDVCPISLQKVTKAVRAIKKTKEFKFFDIEMLFVSIDPDRDSNERIKQYCAIFDQSLIGLTHKSNDDPELKEILKKFKIHSSKIYLTDDEQKEDEDSLKINAPDVLNV